MKDPALYRGIEMVMDAINDETANNEMFIAVNGPKIRESDTILKRALDSKFAKEVGTFI